MALLPKQHGPFKSSIKVDRDKFSKYTIYKFRSELKDWFNDKTKYNKKQAEEIIY